ncbi:MAG: AAA family ATPase [Minisyncoccales bacterium]
MLKKIIGLVGESGSGKDTFCRYLIKKRKNVFCLRFSQPITEALNIFINEIKREDQQWLANLLRKRFGNDILIQALKKKLKTIQKGIIVFNGIRYWEEYQLIKQLKGKIIYITAEPKVRWQRMRQRQEKKDDRTSWQKFKKLEKASTEIYIPLIGRQSDFKINNNGPLKDFYKEINKALKQFNL